MPDNTFEILIKYGLDSTKAKEAAQELNKLKEANKDAGKASEEASKKGVEGAKEHAKHIEGLHKATNLLYRQFGELGHLLHGLVSLPALGITALAISLQKGAEYLLEMRDRLVEVKKEAAALNAANISGLNAQIAAAKAATDQLEDKLSHAGDQNDPIGAQFKAKRARLEAEAKARGGALSPQQERALIAEEFAARQAAAPGLNAAASVASNKATGSGAELLKAQNELAVLVASQPKLIEAVAQASVPTLAQAAKAWAMGSNDEERGNILKELVIQAKSGPQALLDSNVDQQASLQARIGKLSSQRALAASEAARAEAAASGNLSAMGGLVGTATTFEAGQTGALMGRLPGMPSGSPTAKFAEYLHVNGEKDDRIVEIVMQLLDKTKSTAEKLALIDSEVKSLQRR